VWRDDHCRKVSVKRFHVLYAVLFVFPGVERCSLPEGLCKEVLGSLCCAVF
jgi:hypothetical protein